MDWQSAQPRCSCVRQFAWLKIISYMTSFLGALGEGGALASTETSPNSLHLHRAPLGTAATGQGSWKSALHSSLHMMVRACVSDVTFV